MENLKMHTPDLADKNFKKLAALFPNAVTETITGYKANGDPIIERAIDADVLRQEISATVVEGPQERYQFTWPDKKKSVVLANQPIAKTLRLDREKSVGKDGTPGSIDTENIYIEGDNLEALKLLQETYLGKVKMIYIDPPYNTGNDFIYEDDFSQNADEYLGNSGQFDEEGNRLVQNTESNGRFHTDWLNMLYPRLRLAKDLLSKDGVIAISIGFHEMCNLLKLCQDVFSDRQVFSVTVKTSGGKPNGAFNISNEYIVFAVPNDFTPIATEEDMKDYASPYHGMNLATFTQDERPNQAYPIYISTETGIIVGCGKSLAERQSEGSFVGHLKDFVYDYAEAPKGTVAIWPVTNKGEQCVWRLIPDRLMGDWKKGYIKVVPNNSKSTNNKYAIQYLSGGIIEKIKSGEVKTYRISDNPEIPTIDIKDYKTAGAGIASIWDDKSFYTAKGNSDIKALFDKKVFSYPKPVDLIWYILKKTVPSDAIVLDFFSGSASTAHAVMKQNASDEGQRKYIMIQLPEKCEQGSDALRTGYKNLCEIGEERIRRAGKKIKKESPLTTTDLDIGFRVFKVDSSNMEDVYYRPTDYNQGQMELFADNIKPDRTPEDLLFQVMLDLGILLSSDIQETEIAGKKVFSVADGYLIACFDKNVTEETVKAIAQKQPVYAVFRDSSMASDSVATNFEQIFETYSPRTQRKVL
ncbi:site-specific DNA-methyltransferase [Clostridiaceae bacterium Marseille-Q4143]|nr:site-specific DNA-methyltransferase [Clostridiaceae bacterium Marseille-Q4143]